MFKVKMNPVFVLHLRTLGFPMCCLHSPEETDREDVSLSSSAELCLVSLPKN